MTKTVAEQPQNSIPKAQKAQKAILQSHDATRLINNNFHWILGVRPGHDGRFSINNGWCDRDHSSQLSWTELRNVLRPGYFVFLGLYNEAEAFGDGGWDHRRFRWNGAA